MAAQTKPPVNIEEFLWNMHTAAAHSTIQPLPLDQLKDVYQTKLGHKCQVERFLVVGEGGLGATLKRIPHIVALYTDAGVPCVKAANDVSTTRQGLVEVDKNYRAELMRKNQAVKAAAAKAKATPAKAPGAPAATAAKSGAPPPVAADPAVGEKRAAADAAGADAKKPKAGAAGGDSDPETLSRMLVQGVVRVLQNRAKTGKGPLAISDLEEEFKALWKVPFNLHQAGETDVVEFLKKWPSKIEVQTNNDGNQVVVLKKAAEKAKGGLPAKADAAPAAAAPKTATKSSPPVAPKDAAPPAGTPAVPKKAAGPSRPPATIEEFLYNIHSVLEVGPLPVDQLKDAYSKLLGHKCAIERFLVVGEAGLGATLKRIPHVITLSVGADGVQHLSATQPAGTTKEQLVQADQAYRKSLQAKAAAAKSGAPKAPAPVPAATPASAPAAPAKASAVPKRPAEESAAAPDAKKGKPTEDQETLSKMLIQGIVRVLQNRLKEGKGPLLVADLENEFMALWKVPFNLQQAGETDKVVFLQKWPNKVEVSNEGAQQVVQLAKKTAAKAAAPAVAEASTAAAPAAARASSSPALNGVDGASKSVEEILKRQEDILKRQEEVLKRHEEVLKRQEEVLKRLEAHGLTS